MNQTDAIEHVIEAIDVMEWRCTMNLYRPIFVVLFAFAYLSAGFAEDPANPDPACVIPSDRVERHMMRFAQARENWDNAHARDAVRASQPVALTNTNSSDRSVCERLWRAVGPLLAKQKQTEDQEFFKFDAGFYKFGPFYAVAVVENTVDPAREDVNPLDRIHTGAEAAIILFSSDLELLGNYDFRGNSRDRNPNLSLKR